MFMFRNGNTCTNDRVSLVFEMQMKQFKYELKSNTKFSTTKN